MARIIPGVEVDVVKEVVPPPANPSGIVGLVGVTDKGPARGARVGSFKQFIDVFGAASSYSLPEARQLLENGAFELVVVPVDGDTRAGVELRDGDGEVVVRMEARAAGVWANDDLTVEVTNVRNAGTPEDTVFDLVLRYGELEEVFRNLQVADVDSPGYLLAAVNQGSSFAVALPPANSSAPADGTSFAFSTPDERQSFTDGVSLRWLHPGAGRVDVEAPDGAATFNLLVYVDDQLLERFDGLAFDADLEPDGTSALIATLAESDYVRAQFVLAPNSAAPVQGRSKFDGGSAPNKTAYESALDELTKEGDVDMVLASVHGGEGSTLHEGVYAAVAAHCANMSAEAKNRIGFGGAPAGATVDEIVDMAALFNSERFVLVAPPGIVGSVAGRIAQLDYFQSPTFKTLAGVSALSADYLSTDLRTLLRANVLPVDLDRRLGFIVIKGITTSGEQISVTRVQDYSVRGVRRIADLFIGKLNSQLARLSLRQKLSEFFQQMEKDGAIVPSTDGSDPSFKVDVYSSQADFAQGIVRIDIAVRPVRAIDYVMATILVQA